MTFRLASEFSEGGITLARAQGEKLAKRAIFERDQLPLTAAAYFGNILVDHQYQLCP